MLGEKTGSNRKQRSGSQTEMLCLVWPQLEDVSGRADYGDSKRTVLPGAGNVEQREHRAAKYSEWYCNGGYMTLCICSNVYILTWSTYTHIQNNPIIICVPITGSPAENRAIHE